MHIANFMSYSRFLFIALSWAAAVIGRTDAIAIMLILSGISDVLDGHFARKNNIVTDYGAKLDSIADLFAITSGLLFALYFTPILSRHTTLLVIVFIVQAICHTISVLKHKRILSLHLYSAKAAAVIAYLFVIHALLFGYNTVLLYAAGLMIIITGLEQLYIAITQKNPPHNMRSAFF